MRTVFIGTGAIGLPALRWLENNAELVGIVTQPDKATGRSQRITTPPIKAAAMAEGTIPILQPAKIREAVDQIRALQPELIVVMAYGQILPTSVLDLPQSACLNLHASLLPRWRGAAPIQAAIAAGDARTGITVMYMDAGLDTGDILLAHAIEIDPEETGSTLHDRIGELAPAALAEALTLLKKNSAPRERQDPARATLSPKLEREDGKIDWTKSAAEIERTVRAYDPWPGAFTSIAAGQRVREKLKVFRARVLAENGHPGSLLQIDGQIVVGTGDGALALTEVQLAGKKRMSAAEFARGISPPLRIVA